MTNRFSTGQQIKLYRLKQIITAYSNAMVIYGLQANIVTDDIVYSDIIYYNCTNNNSLKTYNYGHGFRLCAEWKRC